MYFIFKKLVKKDIYEGEMMTHVSVVICTYNPDIESIKRTIIAAIKQQDVIFEIIITDDGSKNFPKETIEQIFRSLCFTRYKIVLNKTNVGTVRNILEGLKYSVGEYVFLTSPGDFLADQFVLRDFYYFAKKRHAISVFGNAVFYNYQDEKIQTYSVINKPHITNIFKYRILRKISALAIIEGVKILGASYFREKKCAVKYFNEILRTTKYVEDSTSSLCAILDGEYHLYYDRNIIWYEYGSGISTNGNSKWENIVKNEYDITRSYLFEKYKKNTMVRYVEMKVQVKRHRGKSIFELFIMHPCLFFLDVFLKLQKPVYTRKINLDYSRHSRESG